MKTTIAATVLSSLLSVPALAAPAAPAPVASTPAVAAAAPKVAAAFNLDTPIETIVASPAGKAALDTAIPGLTAHPAFDQFKGMSLKQLQPMSAGKLTDAVLAAAASALAAVK